MKQYISNDIIKNSNILISYESRLLKLEESFDKFSSKQNSILYEGKIYDVYSILIDFLIVIRINYIEGEL